MAVARRGLLPRRCERATTTPAKTQPLGRAGLLAGRLLIAFIFVHEGWKLISNCSGSVAYMLKFGVPGLLLPAVIALELGGGLLIALGAFTP